MTVEELYNEIIKLTPYKSSDEREFCALLKEALEKYAKIVECAYKSGINGIDKSLYNDVLKSTTTINNVASHSRAGRQDEAYKAMEALLNKFLGRVDFFGKNFSTYKENFYRMRLFENRRENISHDEMFHIPLNMRRKVKTQRYSASGYPCLYMGMSVYACWEELGRPKMSDCWVSKLVNIGQFFLLDLRVPNEDTFKRNISERIRTFPLVIASMFPVKNNDDIYKPEYIIPQLVMEWISVRAEVDGIVYTSTMINDDFSFSKDKFDNVAMFVKDLSNETKYCSELAGTFTITSPLNLEIERLKCTSKEYKEYKEYVEQSLDCEVEENYRLSHFGFLEYRLNKCESKLIENPPI